MALQGLRARCTSPEIKKKANPFCAGFAFSFEAAFQSLNTASAAASERQRDGVGAVACAGFANAVGEGAAAAEVGLIHITAGLRRCDEN